MFHPLIFLNFACLQGGDLGGDAGGVGTGFLPQPVQ